MDDLISRKALLDVYDKAHQGPPGGARKLIEEAPDAITRCKNCAFLIDHCGFMNDGYCENMSKKYNIKFKPNSNWFCPDGKRR